MTDTELTEEQYTQQYRREDLPLNKYLDIMGTKQEHGFFDPDSWHTPTTHEHVEGAREDVKSLAKKYASGDPEARSFVKGLERDMAIGNELIDKQKEFGSTLEISSAIQDRLDKASKYYNSSKELDKGTAYNIFVNLAQNRMKQRLNDEDKELTPAQANELNSMANFDSDPSDPRIDYGRLSKILGYPKK